ncbi:MAG: IS200/IS605 family transposase [candidate division KSB1 bacterium]|nr:IS200/IS605 family transposase [candidate division KSB1 bacterium]
MANTYTQIYLQFVFAVKNRMSLIQSDWKDELYKYITGIAQNNKHKLIAINGMPDHLHLFIGYKPHQLIPDLLQDIKGCSSTWINERRLACGKFGWQAGYGAFSYSHSQINNVATYIKNQEKHHRKKSFRTEYIEFLDNFNVDYSDRYIFYDIE